MRQTMSRLLHRRVEWRALGAPALRGLGVLAVVICGVALGSALVPPVTAIVGPLTAEVRVVPSVHPGVELLLPPAGRVEFHTHHSPIAVQASISEVDLEGARALVGSPSALLALQKQAPDELRTAIAEAAALTAGYGIAGATVLSLLVYRRAWRRTAQVAGSVVLLLATMIFGTAATFDADALAQPKFTGLLSQAPYVANQASSMVQRLESYRSGLADIVQGVAALYATSDQLPVLPGAPASDLVTVLHISDIHLNPLGFDLTDRLVRQFKVNVVVDSGDITTWGTEVESSTLSRIGALGVPYVFVRGNHDSLRTSSAVAANRNAIVLDGTVAEVAGIVIAGIGDPYFTPDHAPLVKPEADSATTGPTGPTGPTGATGPTGTAPSQPPSLEERAGEQLAAVIQAWNAGHPHHPVDVADIHEPYGTPPLLGLVPTVLAGHFHTRKVTLDATGTRVMIEGSTGGAGISSDSFHMIEKGEPVPLAASLLYFARSGDRAGQLVAYDEVTVGGFGLASVSLERTVIRANEQPSLAPGEVHRPGRPDQTSSPTTSTGPNSTP